MIRITVFMFCIALLFCVEGVEAQKVADTVAAEWSFDGGDADDDSGQNVNGNFVGKPKSVDGIVGKALEFDGEGDGIKLPDSAGINTGGPHTNRTIAAFFYCDDVDIDARKQVIFEEGGRTRGLVLYVFDGQVYVGGWNRAEYNWNGEWPSADVESKRWHHVGLVVRDAAGKVEKDKFELWLDGKRVAKEDGGQLHAHSDDNGIGHTNQNTVYHDEGGGGSDIDWFGGLIDEMIVYNSPFDEADFAELAQPLSVEPHSKFTTTWAHLKAQRTDK